MSNQHNSSYSESLFFEGSTFGEYTLEDLNENIEKEKLEILVELHKLKLSVDIVEILDKKYSFCTWK